MKRMILSTALAIGLAGGAMAGDLVTVASGKSVADTMDALQAAVEGAGATVFARVDHAKGAESVGMEIGANQVLIFGNPKLGTPAMVDAPSAGLFLPLKVQVYEGADGATVIAYEDPASVLGPLGAPADAEYLKMMTGALGKLTAKAAE